ncbi:MAG: thiol oxidoreductase-like protein [Blastocatellia bacterium]|nr:MAG: thiol oxidoreductase-like protein [Blastocatellia bacterium]
MPFAQLVDRNLAPNTAQEGINKTLEQEIGGGRGDGVSADNGSLFIIKRDPFRAIRRGRQLFQRKFTRLQGQGPVTDDDSGDINTVLAIGAGLCDSCAGCHGRPRGSGGAGGDVATRPDSRDAPHLFGLGLKEMLADEITSDLRAIRATTLSQAIRTGQTVRHALISKGIDYGFISATASGTVITTEIQGVDPDLRVRPFFAHGGTISIREFVAGALHAELGINVDDPELAVAHAGARIVTPAGMVLDGSQDLVEAPPDTPEMGPGPSQALLDYFEFYLLNYFKPGVYQQTPITQLGRKTFQEIGCVRCHKADLVIQHDRRVADVETVYNPERGIFNNLFATATPLFQSISDGNPVSLKLPVGGQFVVKDIFTDLKRHDLGPNFYERNYDGSIRTQFMTFPLWGVATTAPYGHDGRSVNLTEVILRHGGEAQAERDEFAALPAARRIAVLEFLRSLVLFPPDDTASNLDPGNRSSQGFPQFGHGSIKLTVLFNDPADKE